MQSTISLFRHLYENLPPLFPEEVKVKIKHALEHLEKDQTVTLDEIESTMISFGYEAWPWNQAYHEFLAIAEGEVGEHFLLPRLSPGLQAKYEDFKGYGMTLRDLHSGRPADYFTSEERVEIGTALVDMQKDLRVYLERKLISENQDKYLKRVEEFSGVLIEMQGHLNGLRELAENEQDHPTLAGEIREQVRSFEHGLCLLGPELRYDAVYNSLEFFHGRKAELNRMRGIHETMEIDFYKED